MGSLRTIVQEPHYTMPTSDMEISQITVSDSKVVINFIKPSGFPPVNFIGEMPLAEGE